MSKNGYLNGELNLVEMISKWLGKKKTGLDLIREVRTDDCFIASYPKSGNTWVRFILANALTSDQVTFKNLNSFVPGIYGHAESIDNMDFPRFIKTHDSQFDKYPKCIAIVRNPKELIVSYYHYHVGNKAFEGSIEEYVKDFIFEKEFGRWDEHCLKLRTAIHDRPESFLLLKYEHLLEDAETMIDLMLDYCNIEPEKSVEEIVSLTSFSALQNNESEHGRVFDTKLQFFRNGQSDSYKSELSQDLQKLINERYESAMTWLAYE